MSKNLLIFFLLSLCLSCKQSNITSKISDDRTVKSAMSRFPDLEAYVTESYKTFAYENINLINGSGQAMKSNQTVIIEDGKFLRVGDSGSLKIPTEAHIYDGEGLTMMPGIVGTHNHLHMPGYPHMAETAAKLYLAHGVTTIQTCGATSTQAELDLADKISEGRNLGPEIIASAPYMTGPGGSRAMIIPENEFMLRDTMQYWLDRGIKWFKVYRHIEPDFLRIIIDHAHKNEAKVTGHLCSVTFEEAVEMGIDGIEHGFNSTSDFRSDKVAGQCNGGREYIDEIDVSGEKCLKLQKLMIENDVFLNSTLSIYEASVPSRSEATAATRSLMSPVLLGRYEERRKVQLSSSSKIDREARMKRIMAFDYQYFQLGGLLGTGVDAGRHNLFGIGDLRNYELLLEAGLSAEEAIQVMTYNGAQIVGREDIGQVSEGRRADFLILGEGFLAGKQSINAIEKVFKEGVSYNRKKILEELQGKVGL